MTDNISTIRDTIVVGNDAVTRRKIECPNWEPLSIFPSILRVAATKDEMVC